MRHNPIEDPFMAQSLQKEYLKNRFVLQKVLYGGKGNLDYREKKEKGTFK